LIELDGNTHYKKYTGREIDT